MVVIGTSVALGVQEVYKKYLSVHVPKGWMTCGACHVGDVGDPYPPPIRGDEKYML